MYELCLRCFGSKPDVYLVLHINIRTIYIYIYTLFDRILRTIVYDESTDKRDTYKSLRWKTIYSYTIIRVINIRETEISM